MEMNEEELAKLTQEQIDTLVALEVAHKGIEPVQKPDPIDEEIPIKKTETAWMVDGTYFTNKSDAEKVLKMPRLKKSYDYSIGYNYEWFEPADEDSEIKLVSVYKHTEVLDYGRKLQKLKKMKDEYDDKKKKWDEYNKQISEIQSEVLTKITSASQKIKEQEWAMSEYERYMKLADNNPIIAIRFFQEGFKNKPHLIEHITRAIADPKYTPKE